MEILKVYEEKDGFVRMDCEFSELEIERLLSYAVTDILKARIEEMDESGERPCFHCEGEIDKETIERFPDTELFIDCIDDAFKEGAANE